MADVTGSFISSSFFSEQRADRDSFARLSALVSGSSFATSRPDSDSFGRLGSFVSGSSFSALRGIPGACQAGPTTFYVMRAYHTSAPTGYFYWESDINPDVSGTHAPYPFSELQTIVIVKRALLGA